MRVLSLSELWKNSLLGRIFSDYLYNIALKLNNIFRSNKKEKKKK